MDNTEKLACLSLCTGYGGLELALRRCLGKRVRTVAYVEIEAFAVANLVEKMEEGMLDAAPVWTDIKTFAAKPFQDRIHIITAGYPCQPFSSAGKRKGRKDPRHLWPVIRDIIEEIRPVLVICENVAGHLKNGFPAVALDLAGLGYAIEAGLFTAAEVGAPHLRTRLFFVAYREDADRWFGGRGKSGKTGKRGAGLGLGDIPDNSSRRFTDGERKQTRKFTLKSGSKNVSDVPGERCEITECEKIENGQTNRFPAGPGRPQYGWEQPRVIRKPDKRTGDAVLRKSGKSKEHIKPGHKRPTEPGLGGATDGFAHWVDRMRLLGNGIVPQQAAKAIMSLFEPQRT